MKHKDFYLYQLSETILNISIKTVGILFAWLMLTSFNLPQSLGIFIGISWIFQVIILLLFSWIYQQSNIKIDNKKILILFCIICLLSFSLIIFNKNYLIFGIVFIVISICSIVLNPLGTSLTNELYQDIDKSTAFKVRGFVNSINTILSPAISGFVIYYFATETIIISCIVLSLISAFLFYSIKISDENNNDKDQQKKNSLKILLFNPVERLMAIASAVCNFVITPIIAYIIPYRVAHQFKLSAFYVGVSESFFGLGMIMGSVFLIKLLNNKIGKYYTLILSILLVAFGILLSIIQNFYIFCLSLMLMGIGVVLFNINSTHIRCTATPNNIRKSFEFVFLSFCVIFIPVGLWIATWALDKGYLDYLYLASTILIILLSARILFSKDIKKIYQLNDEGLMEYYAKRYKALYCS